MLTLLSSPAREGTHAACLSDRKVVSTVHSVERKLCYGVWHHQAARFVRARAGQSCLRIREIGCVHHELSDNVDKEWIGWLLIGSGACKGARACVQMRSRSASVILVIKTVVSPLPVESSKYCIGFRHRPMRIRRSSVCVCARAAVAAAGGVCPHLFGRLDATLHKAALGSGLPRTRQEEHRA